MEEVKEGEGEFSQTFGVAGGAESGEFAPEDQVAGQGGQ